MRTTAGVALGAALFILLVWFLWAAFSVQIAHHFLGTVFIPAQAGPWGDSFGAFNALFGALGFAAVVGTLVLQMKAIARQERDQHRQQFESTFFNLITLFGQVRKEVRFAYSAEYQTADVGRSAAQLKGRVAILAAARELSYWLERAEAGGVVLSREEIARIYRRRIHRRFENSLSPYFRMIYTMLDWIRTDATLSDADKNKYANIVRSQLNTRELQLIGSNALTKEAKDMDTLVEQFRLLKYLPSGATRRRLRNHYTKETFEGREN